MTTRRHAPPPTRFGSPVAAQAKPGQAGSTSHAHAPPATRYGPTPAPIQQKTATSPVRPTHGVPSTRFGPIQARATSLPAVVQPCCWPFSLCCGGSATVEDEDEIVIHKAYDEDDDETPNFDALLPKLPKPTPQAAVTAAVKNRSNIEVTLWRGTSGEAAVAMRTYGSAGRAAADPQTEPPLREQARQQVGKGGRLPEFTTNTGIAEGFSLGHWLVIVKINTRYLAKGSGSEDGWIAQPSAPAKIVTMVDRTGGKPEKPGANAS